MTIQKRLDSYIDEVLNNTHRHNKYEILAVKRHLRDLEREDFPYYFDITKAEKVVQFIELLKHYKGDCSNQYFILEPWQIFVITVLFGWLKKRNDKRRFFRSYIEVARKNGKSTLAAGIALYMMVADGEAGSEGYVIATKEKQAKIAWNDSAQMVQRSTLRSIIKKTTNRLSHLTSASFLEPLGRDSETSDGFNPYFVLVDEYHSHKSNDLINVMESGMGYRTQPMVFIITTAGKSTAVPCYEERERIIQNLTTKDDDLRDESTFGLIFTLDEDDDWLDETKWIKANPNLHIQEGDFIPNRIKKAKLSTTEKMDVLTKNFNIWVDSDSEWISQDVWNSCRSRIKPDWLNGDYKIAGAFDLSLSNDLTAYVKVVEVEDKFVVIPKFYMPEGVVDERTEKDKVPYRAWVHQGLITATPGVVVDYDYVRKDILDDEEKHGLSEVAYDPYNARKLVDDLIGDGLTMVEFRQSKGNMTEPTKEVERLILQKRIIHDGNPVLSWMIQNVQIEHDAFGNIQPKKVDKNKRRRKIDGVIAMIMALDRCKTSVHQQHNVYEERGVIDISF